MHIRCDCSRFSWYCRLIRCAMAAGCCLVPVLAYAEEQNLAGVQTNADGSASISIATPHRFASVFLDGDLYTSDYSLEVALPDRGQMASIFMAVEFNGDWFLKAASAWTSWDPISQEPMPFRQELLSESVDIQVLANDVLTAGDYTIYAAYQVSGEELVVALEPLSFAVQAANADSLHAFDSDAAMEAYLKEGLQISASDQTYRVLEIATLDASTTGGGTTASTRVSATNLQEADVDEADTVKTDGSYLFTLRTCADKTCVISYELDADTSTATELASQALVGSVPADGMYLIQNRPSGNDLLVTVAGTGSSPYWFDVWYWVNNVTELEFFDASDPAALQPLETLTIEGQLIASRRIGEVLYVVSRYTPLLPGYERYADTDQARADNAAILADSSLSDLLPSITDSQQQVSELISYRDCYLPTKSLDENTNPSIITVSAIPLEAPTDHQSTCFLGDSETLYMTADSLYLATTQNDYQIIDRIALVYSPQHTTAIHKFALVDGGIDYRGSAQVEGHLGWSEDKKSFRMGENGAYLNVVTSLGDTWNELSSTRLTVLKESSVGGTLETVNVIDGIGKPGEQLYAARFLGDRAYLVTFRLTDPLYVVDLSDQENPVITGELEIDGYSDYLHPVSETLLLGIGKDAILDETSFDFGGARGAWYQGLKLALFDVSDPANPREVDALVLGQRGTTSAVLFEHHALSFLAANGSDPARLAIPIDLFDTVPSSEFFDAASPSAFYDYTHTGLYSFEISEGGINQVGIILGTGENDPFGFSRYSDRSVLLDDSVFYIHQGEVLSSDWGQE